MMHTGYHTEDEDEEPEDAEAGLADDLLDEIDEGFGDDALDAETLAVPDAEDDDEEKVDFDRHDDVDKI